MRIITVAFFLFLILGVRGHKANAQSKPAVTNGNAVADFKFWLTNSWLKSMITYDTVRSEQNILHLDLKLNCLRGCDLQWQKISQALDSTKNHVLESYLFDKASFLLEKGPKSLVINIYNLPPTSFDEPCFYRGISFQDSLIVQVVSCKDITDRATLNYSAIKPSLAADRTGKIIRSDSKADDLLEFLFKKCQVYFKPDGNNVLVNMLAKGDHSIKFEVRNANNIVIAKPTLSPFQDLEVLRFEIFCNFHDKGLEFEVNLNGKYASNWLKPSRETGYKDMEVDYKDDLQHFVTVFTNNTLMSWLK